MNRSIIIICSIGLVVLSGFYFLQVPAREVATITTPTSDTNLTIRVPATQKILPTTDGPHTPDGMNSHWFYSEPIVLEKDTTITGFSVAMEGASLSILHHVSVVVLGKEALICPQHFANDGGAYEIYSASRNTLDPIVLPAPYGITLAADDKLIVEFMAHPQAMPHGEHASTEILEPTLVVTMNTDDSHTTPVEFVRLRLDDSPCVAPLPHQAFVVPTSTASSTFTKTAANNEASSEYYFEKETTIVLGNANFWPRKGGEAVTVLLNDTIVDEFYAVPGTSPNQWNIPLSQKLIPIPAGSTVGIQSTYTNPFTVPVKDAAGMYGFYFIAP
jgi:hypothetical protein